MSIFLHKNLDLPHFSQDEGKDKRKEKSPLSGEKVKVRG